MESVIIAAITSLSTVVVTLVTAGPALSKRRRAEAREAVRRIDELEAHIYDERRAIHQHNAAHHPDGAGELEPLPPPDALTEEH